MSRLIARSAPRATAARAGYAVARLGGVAERRRRAKRPTIAREETTLQVRQNESATSLSEFPLPVTASKVAPKGMQARRRGKCRAPRSSGHSSSFQGEWPKGARW